MAATRTALDVCLPQGRTKDFGNNKDRANPVIVDVASGIPCGVAAKSGNDVDAIGIVFLQRPSAAVLDGVAYAGLPTSQARRGCAAGAGRDAGVPGRCRVHA